MEKEEYLVKLSFLVIYLKILNFTVVIEKKAHYLFPEIKIQYIMEGSVKNRFIELFEKLVRMLVLKVSL